MNLPELLQISGYYWRTCTLHAGVKMDLFSPLAQEPMRTEDLARLRHADLRGLQMLLDALCAMELLEKMDHRFRCTEFSATYLAKESPQYMGHIIMHHHYLVEGWNKLDQAVQKGTPVRRSSSHDTDGRERESFLMGMFNLANQLAPKLAEQLDLAGKKRLLDLAGGPGTYAIHFCNKYPQLEAVVVDLPTTRPFAEATIGRFGLNDRIRFLAGDVLAEPYGSGFDVVWISHLLHSLAPTTCQAVVDKATAALTRGGQILIQEFILENDRTAPLHPALFSLNMLLGTKEGQAYSEGDLATMLSRAGLVEVQRLPITLPNGAGIMRGVKG
ncbi:MAG: methyltransferase [Desulfobulbus sp.]|nr:methyltransferase [Desulfobulbus sp.]